MDCNIRVCRFAYRRSWMATPSSSTVCWRSCMKNIPSCGCVGSTQVAMHAHILALEEVLGVRDYFLPIVGGNALVLDYVKFVEEMQIDLDEVGL